MARREFQDNLNLVPFIDLFSTLIIFLLSIAVWDNLAALSLSLGAEDKASVEAPKEDIKKIKSNVKITVKTDMIETFDEGKTDRFPIVEGQAVDFAPVDQFVAGLREKYPDKKDMLVYSTDNAVYENLIGVMDRLYAVDFREITVAGLEQQ